MKKAAFAALLLVLVVTVAAWLGMRKVDSLASVPPAALALERALAETGLVAVGTLNVGALAELERWRFGRPAEAGSDTDPGADDSWSGRLRRLGIDPSRDLSHVTAAVRQAPGGGADIVVGLFGAFPHQAISRELAEQDQFEAEQVKVDGQPVWRVSVYDRESCEVSGPWDVHLSPERVLVAQPESMPALLARLREATAPDRDLERFAAFREGKLVAGALFVPDQVPSTDNPLVDMSAGAARDQLDPFRAIYLGMGFQLLPVGFRAESMLEATEPGAAAETAEAWAASLQSSREEWQDRLPTLSELHDTLSIRATGQDVLVDLALGTDAIEKLGEVPGELLGLMFGGAQVAVAGDGGAPQADQLDENPLVFASELAKAAIPDYDPEAPFHGRADATAGPFGVRISALRISEDPAQGTEIEIEAIAGSLPNAGDRGERAFLDVTRALDADGRELLHEPRCGPARPNLEVALGQSFGTDLSGKKSVRLVSDARSSDVSRLEGHLRLLLPTRTEGVRVAPEVGALVERAEARLELTQVGPRSFSYHLSGQGDRLLHLRALNSQGKPLQRAGSSHSGSLIGGGGTSGSIQFAGSVATVEAVFALEEQELRYPFALASARPGTAGEHTVDDAPPPAAAQWKDSLEQWLASLADQAAGAVERIVDGQDEPQAVDEAGPFVVTLETVWSFGGLMPRFEVHAPPIDALHDSLSGMQFALEEVRLSDGSVHHPDGVANGAGWTELVSFGRDYETKRLEGNVQLQTGVAAPAEQIESMQGSLHVRLPRNISVRRLRGLEPGSRLRTRDLDVQLAELSRDGFVLQVDEGVERIVAARAYSADGDQLWLPTASLARADDGTWRASFQVKGVPAEIDLVVADRLSNASYPFSLVIPPAVPASAAVID